MTSPLVLLVEDEPRIAEVQLAYLRQAGMRTEHLLRGDEVVDWVRANRPDLVLLDLMLPGLDGTAVCSQLRAFTDVPVIMVTARVEEIDRLLGFDVGADDYLCKPFSPRELVARAQVCLRRRGKTTAAPRTPTSALSIDEERQCATWNGARLELTAQQFRLLSVMARQPGRIFSRAQLLELAFEAGSERFDRAIDSQIKNLRKKLSQQVADQELIHSVYGVGYRFEYQPA
ncbi:response regulator [Massilia sp. CCM 8695]|uniref:Response regulator n=1 Tax=Massilia frigida TaxID=2609281 RepID=A0ABX0N7S5_9BURK|nr:response regulator [Massilia frigida]NHZ79316.1 response regulator [Massilia frigida]